RASVELLRTARYKSCFVFKYSPRTGTVAHRRFEDSVPEGEKRARNLELLEVQGEITQSLFSSYVGQELEVLVEGFGKLKADREERQELVQLGKGLRTAAPSAQPSSDWVRLRGRTEGDEIVVFDGPASLVGRLTRVRAQ